jgi:hypothetical protein
MVCVAIDAFSKLSGIDAKLKESDDNMKKFNADFKEFQTIPYNANSCTFFRF